MKSQILKIYQNTYNDIDVRAHNLASSQRFYIYMSVCSHCAVNY